MNYAFHTLLFSAIISFSSGLLLSESESLCCTGCAQSQNIVQPHSFSINMTREIILQKEAWINHDDEDNWHGSFGVGFDYIKSLYANACNTPTACCKTIGTAPFWSSDQSNQMTIGNNSGSYDVDAYQLGMGPVTTEGTLTITPTFYQVGADFFFYFGQRKAARGWFAKLQAPVAMSCMDTQIQQCGKLEPEIYTLNSLESAETTDPLYNTIVEAFFGGVSGGDLVAMELGRIALKRSSQVKISDLMLSIGYNFLSDSCKHLGIAVRFTAPTGNIADGIYVLQPIIGRNGHWAVGGELIGHWRCYEHKEHDSFVDIWLDGAVDHLFKSVQLRSFDLRENGFGSKYLLLANYANNTYQNEITNAVNITTIPIKSTFSVEGNAALLIDCHHRAWSVAFGYEAWGRTCEKLELPCNCPLAVNYNDYAVLGRQNVVDELCQPTATIGKSVDQMTASNNTSSLVVSALDKKNRLTSDIENTLNIEAQRALAALTHKGFLQIAYTYKKVPSCPFVGLLGAAEFSSKKNSAISSWYIGLQGGVSL